MSPKITHLLAMLPEDKHDDFLSRLPAKAAAAIAAEAEDVDPSTLNAIAETVWACLED